MVARPSRALVSAAVVGRSAYVFGQAQVDFRIVIGTGHAMALTAGRRASPLAGAASKERKAGRHSRTARPRAHPCPVFRSVAFGHRSLEAYLLKGATISRTDCRFVDVAPRRRSGRSRGESEDGRTLRPHGRGGGSQVPVISFGGA